MGAYSPYSCFVKIDVKDNRYRVTVSDVVFEGIDVRIVSAIPITLEDFAVKNNKAEFRKNKTAMSLLINLNTDFNNYFTLKQVDTDDDW